MAWVNNCQWLDMHALIFLKYIVKLYNYKSSFYLFGLTGKQISTFS